MMLLFLISLSTTISYSYRRETRVFLGWPLNSLNTAYYR